MANIWTKEQLEAIHQDNNNIIVSAGAGSGKTAVLSERVLRKIQDGIHIDQILILTFTNAAAKEMKDRIRNKLMSAKKQEEVELIDHAYITTFDSFCLSIVKKYHTILNISKDIEITDSSLLNIKKQEIIDEIFDDYYLQENDAFNNLIKHFCLKDDEGLKRLILKLNDKLDLKYNKKEYINTYLDTFYQKEFINHGINLYYQQIQNLIEKIKETIRRLNHYLDFSYIIKLEDQLSSLLKAKNYDEVASSFHFRLPNLPRNQEEIVKSLKESLSNDIKEIKSLCIYKDTEEMRREYQATKEDVKVILELVFLLDQKLNMEKRNNNMFDFSDISKMAIDIILTNKEVKEELTNHFQEIMIDEYQDTNDIGEYLISLISHHNVYMVGDIKQSIYRFRNANPYIFKSKYDAFQDINQGIKIDLLKNFRSRKEVLEDINLLFNDLMEDELGGADYKKSHQMVFGNMSYQEEGKTKQNYHLSILTYEKEKTFSIYEKEAFIIAEDIKEKINQGYQIFDKDQKVLRKAKYHDFVILMDRSTDFNAYHRIFEYMKIPLTVYQDEEMSSNYDIMVIKNLLKLIYLLDHEDFKEEFKYAFLSVGRSFLFQLSDEELFEYLTKETYKESIIYQKLEEAYFYYYELSPKMFFIKLCEIFDYEKKLLTIGNIKIERIRLEYFYRLLDQFSKNGKDIEDFIIYLDTVFEKEEKVRFKVNSKDANSVKIMTIHKSKGLEFPICYFSGFTKEFSFKELNDSILYSNQYGIITPYFNEYEKPTIFHTLLKMDNRKEELSEKIRLFYVALTRAKEKMIMVMPEIDEKIEEKNKIKSFYDMMKIMFPKLESYMDKKTPNCTKDYLKVKQIEKEEEKEKKEEVKIEEVFLKEEEDEIQRFSKINDEMITKEEKKKMDLGIKIHKTLEFIDLKNPNYDNLDPFVSSKVEKFLSSDIIVKNLGAKFYQEYEFSDDIDGRRLYGIIDLMIEKEDELIIIDYKLKNVLDPAYQKQLEGYARSMRKKTSKKISTYLYSILEEKLIPIKKQESYH